LAGGSVRLKGSVVVIAFPFHGDRTDVVLCFAGEKLQDTDVDAILKFTGTEEDLDGNIKYEGEVALH